jgi:hypothetical protein
MVYDCPDFVSKVEKPGIKAKVLAGPTLATVGVQELEITWQSV